jgi:hypothetical protein
MQSWTACATRPDGAGNIVEFAVEDEISKGPRGDLIGSLT